MLGGLPPEILVPGGLSGLVLAGLWALFSGRIYPGSAVERIEREAAKAVKRADEERDEWKALALELLAQNRTLIQPVSEVISAADRTR